MNRDPILFRVDGTTALGWERLQRCLTYAAALQRRRRPTYFLSQLEPRAFGLAIKRSGSDWLDADSTAGTAEDVAEVVQEVRRLRPAAVIVDAPGATQPYLTEIGAAGPLVVSIDHQAATQFPSQLVINPLLGLDRESYEFCPGTQLLLGARYALVRPEVRRIRPTRSQEPPAPYSALIALSEDDPKQKTIEMTQMLMAIPKVERIDVVARPEHPQFARLQELSAAYPDRLKLASEPAEVVSRIARCHFAVTAGDTWSLELACVGVPQLLFVLSEDHWPTAQRLEEEGAATCLGAQDNVSASTVRQAVQNLLADPLERQAMARCGRQLIDGRGPDRLVTALEVMLHPSRQVRMTEAA
ncbi:MAG: polysaccharide biosynthesis protein [Gemmataceae bacterium]|nr:polysaccharide biosynthesis protein [Gemmataceae bacterium]